MPDKKISGFNPAAALTGAEIIPLVQGGNNVIVDLNNILAYIAANSPTTLADILTNGNTTGGFDFLSENGWAKVSASDIKAAVEWNDGTNVGFLKANPYKTEMGHNILNQFNAPINQFVGNIEFNGTYSLDVKATAGSDVLNIGTTNADVINIGNASSTINFLGTALYEYAANQYVLDKLITLNYNGASASGVGAGFEIEEGGSITGYLKTNGARNAFSIKVPGIFYYSDLSLFKLSDNRTHYLPDFDGDLLSAGGTYSNPSWLTTLAFSKITSKPNTLSGYGITDALNRQPLTTSIVSSATPSPNVDNTDMYIITALAVDATFSAPTGTPGIGQMLLVRVKDNGTPRNLTFASGTWGYRFSTDLPAPTGTITNKTLYMAFAANLVDSKYDCIGYLNNF